MSFISSPRYIFSPASGHPGGRASARRQDKTRLGATALQARAAHCLRVDRVALLRRVDGSLQSASLAIVVVASLISTLLFVYLYNHRQRSASTQ
jgi:hypothetical protein